MPAYPDYGKAVSKIIQTCPDCRYSFQYDFTAEDNSRYTNEVMTGSTGNMQKYNGTVQKRLGTLRIDRPLVFLDTETTGLDKTRDRIVEMCFRRGLLILPCGPTSLRFVPPLVIGKEEANEALDIFEDALRKIGKGRS